MPRAIDVKALEDYRIWLKFDDGIEGVADLSGYKRDGVYAIWSDCNEFRKVQVGNSGEIAWGAQLDLCPDALYLKVTGKIPEDLFPRLKATAHHA